MRTRKKELGFGVVPAMLAALSGGVFQVSGCGAGPGVDAGLQSVLDSVAAEGGWVSVNFGFDHRSPNVADSSVDAFGSGVTIVDAGSSGP